MTTPLNIVVNKNTPFVVEAFSRIGHVIALDTPEVTRAAVKNADILIVRSETRVDKALLEGSAVRFVGTVTIGTDHIDTDYLQARGIRFASAPGSNANSVAEYMAAALLTWSQRTAQTLEGKTLGIVGVGNVGCKVVGVAESLGMEVMQNDPPLARATGDASYRPLDELMEADIITLHVPLTRSGPDATFHLFDETRIKKMKRGAVLINTARGGVVDTRAAKAALDSGHLSSAIIDVWEGEPDIDIDFLRKAMIGTPHIAGYSLDGKLNALRMVYHQVCRYLNITMEWTIDTDEQDSPRISIPEAIAGKMEIVRYAVRQVYDIELDDSMLRRMTSLPNEERGSYFQHLRAEYRVRREFVHQTVELLPRQESVRGLLHALGFKTGVREEIAWSR
jgi:erythronate-4-phosphate dehydrogenase